MANQRCPGGRIGEIERRVEECFGYRAKRWKIRAGSLRSVIVERQSLRLSGRSGSSCGHERLVERSYGLQVRVVISGRWWPGDGRRGCERRQGFPGGSKWVGLLGGMIEHGGDGCYVRVYRIVSISIVPLKPRFSTPSSALALTSSFHDTRFRL